MREKDDNELTALARRFVERPRVPTKMTGSTTAGGNSDDTAIWTLPQEIGDVGDVLTVVNDGGDVVPDWIDPGTIVGGGRYRQYVVVSDGSGGFAFVDDGSGNPVYTLEALE